MENFRNNVRMEKDQKQCASSSLKARRHCKPVPTSAVRMPTKTLSVFSTQVFQTSQTEKKEETCSMVQIFWIILVCNALADVCVQARKS